MRLLVALLLAGCLATPSETPDAAPRGEVTAWHEHVEFAAWPAGAVFMDFRTFQETPCDVRFGHTYSVMGAELGYFVGQIEDGRMDPVAVGGAFAPGANVDGQRIEPAETDGGDIDDTVARVMGAGEGTIFLAAYTNGTARLGLACDAPFQPLGVRVSRDADLVDANDNEAGVGFQQFFAAGRAAWHIERPLGDDSFVYLMLSGAFAGVATRPDGDVLLAPRFPVVYSTFDLGGSAGTYGVDIVASAEEPFPGLLVWGNFLPTGPDPAGS